MIFGSTVLSVAEHMVDIVICDTVGLIGGGVGTLPEQKMTSSDRFHAHGHRAKRRRSPHVRE